MTMNKSTEVAFLLKIGIFQWHVSFSGVDIFASPANCAFFETKSKNISIFDCSVIETESNKSSYQLAVFNGDESKGRK